MNLERALQMVASNEDPLADRAIKVTDPADTELLDAYSRAVMGVVRSIGPAVVSVHESGTSGSGVILSPDGFFLTNSHVIHGLQNFTVIT